MKNQFFNAAMLIDEDGAIQENIELFVKQVIDLAYWDKIGSEFYSVMEAVEKNKNASLEDVKGVIKHLESSRNVAYNIGYTRNILKGDRVSFNNSGKTEEGIVLEVIYSKNLQTRFKIDLVSTYITVDASDVYKKI